MYALITQGYYYNKADDKTRIDWWISTRDTVLFVGYLIIMSIFLMKDPTEVNLVQAVILIVVYIIHVVLMKFNHKYEVATKRAVANFLEVRELNNLALDSVSHFHYNLDTRTLPIEILNKINYT